MAKKFNAQTGGYKIDIFINDKYYASTDWYKRCKDAQKALIERYIKEGKPVPRKVKCFFDTSK